jgi:hypothetical protein
MKGWWRFMQPEEYTPDAVRKMRLAVKDAQKNARVRCIDDSLIDDVTALIEDRPDGIIKATGGSVPLAYQYKAEATVLIISWYSWRRKKWISWHAYRDSAGKTSGGGDAGFTSSFDKEKAWEMLFPERCGKYRDIKARRTAKCCGFTLPEDRKYRSVLDIDAGMLLAETDNWQRYLYSPLGCLKMPDTVQTVYQAAKSLGFKLPNRKEQRTWQKAEPLWIMAVLSK